MTPIDWIALLVWGIGMYLFTYCIGLYFYKVFRIICEEDI